MLRRAGVVRPNYKDEHIPVGAGLVFFVSLILSSIVLMFFSLTSALNLLTLLFVVLTMTLLGIIDDLVGSGDTRGLKGHFKKLIIEKELTTGAFKALIGGMVGLLISLTLLTPELSVSFLLMALLYTLIIALTTNFINLLDLRPGRAGKGFILIALLLIIIGFKSEQITLLGLILGSILAYIPKDLKAEAMMGDAGSNVLGVTLGLFSLWVLSLPYQIGLLVILIVLHIITEKYSLTRIIKKNKFLNYLDMLGRARNGSSDN